MKEKALKVLAKPVIEFVPLGGAEEVGRSCYLIGDGEKYVILDCGISPKTTIPPRFDLLEGKEILAVLVSHSHLDHVGALPSLSHKIRDIKIISTELTKKLSRITLEDAIRVQERKGITPLPLSSQLEKNWETKEYDEEFQLDDGIITTFKDAGHIPGSAQIFINWKGTKIVYTGDACAFKTNISGKLEKWTEGSHVIISESTYGEESPKSKGPASVITEEKKLVDEIKRVLGRKGRILIPSFANGRAQEIMYVIANAIEKKEIPRVPCYSVGMLNTMLDIIGEDSAYQKKVAKIQKHFIPINLPRKISAKPEWCEEFRVVKENKEPSIIVSTPGMLTTGASANLSIKIFDESSGAIFIVGYQDEDSPGHLLEEVEKGGKFTIGGSTLEVKCEVKKFEIRGHSHPEDLVKMITEASPKLVVFVHGSRTAQDKMKERILRLAPKCLAFSSVKKTCIRLYTDEWRYQLIELPAAPVVEKVKSFVVDGAIEGILLPREFAQEKAKEERTEEEWNEAVLRAKFLSVNAHVLGLWIPEYEGYPKRVRILVRGNEEKILEVVNGILKNLKIVGVVVKTDWLPFEGKTTFNEVTRWLGSYEPRASRVHLPVFDSAPMAGGTGLYRPKGRIFINPIVHHDESLKKATLYHEVAHHLMDEMRGDLLELLQKHGFKGKAFIEGAAEYVAYKLGADRIFIETERVGDDGVYYPTSHRNPYVWGWYMFTTVDKAKGEKAAIEILTKGSPKSLEKAFAWAKRSTERLERLFRDIGVAGRLYLLGALERIEEKVEAILLYATGIGEGRLYIGEKVVAVKNLREKKSLLYRLGRFFRIIKHPWLEADYVAEKVEEPGDFNYRIPPGEICCEIRVPQNKTLPC